MSNFQRMIVIPQEEYLAMSSFQNIREPLTQHFSNLEKRYTVEENERDPYRRMVMQSNTLDEMKQVKDHLRNSLNISTPKPYQNRAKALFNTLDSLINFNVKGEIYSDDGSIIENSRIEDLIQHAVRDRRRNMTPTGWSDFISILRKHNVPKSILNRDTLDELEEKVPIKQNRESQTKMRNTLTAKRRQPTRREKPDASAFGKKRKQDFKFLKEFKNE